MNPLHRSCWLLIEWNKYRRNELATTDFVRYRSTMSQADSCLGFSVTALVALLVVFWFLDSVGKGLLEQELYLLIQ